MVPSISTVCFTIRRPTICVKKSMSCCAPPAHAVIWWMPDTLYFIFGLQYS